MIDAPSPANPASSADDGEWAACPQGAHPFDALTPERVLQALESTGLWGDGRLTALNSFENRVYLAHLEDPSPNLAAVVLKFYRPGRWTAAQIQEEHDFALELAQAEVPVVAPMCLKGQTLHTHGGFWFSVSPQRGGRRPELEQDEVLEWTGRFLARMHLVGERRPFTQRPRMDATQFGINARDWLLFHEAVPPECKNEWRRTVDQTLDLLSRRAPELMDPPGTNRLGWLRIHGDCHPGNILWTPTGAPGAGPHFVDLDDTCTGPAIQDLWMLLLGTTRQEQTWMLSALLDGYEQVRPFDRRELHLIEPLRTLRQIHHCAWLAKRWTDPIFPANFPWFGTRSFWADQIHQLQEQQEAMERPALLSELG